MSDYSQGPGWWQASDDRWYPPESAPTLAQAATEAGPPTAVLPGGPLPSEPLGRPGPVGALAPTVRRPWGRFRSTPPLLQALAGAIVAALILVIAVTAAGTGHQQPVGNLSPTTVTSLAVTTLPVTTRPGAAVTTRAPTTTTTTTTVPATTVPATTIPATTVPLTTTPATTPATTTPAPVTTTPAATATKAPATADVPIPTVP